MGLNMTDGFAPDDIAEAEEYPSLGPAYFAARRVCERAMAAFEAEHMRPLVEKIRDAITDRIWTSVQASLWSDTEMNLHNEVCAMVDATVRALLAGDEWALRRYVLAERYDCGKIRASVAVHIPEQIQDLRIKDLEAEVAQLREQIEWLRR